MDIRSKDLTHTFEVASKPSRAKERIFSLALPIIGAMLSQNLLNLVDTAMVGSLGDTALAAVGVGGFATLMSVALLMGFSSAVQAIASRRLGQGRLHEAAYPLNGAILLCLLSGIPAALFLMSKARWLMSHLNSDPDIVAAAVPYYRVRVASLTAVGINLAFSGFWNGTNRPRISMCTVWCMHACNVLFNYLLIFGHFGFPALGAAGAAYGTTISLYFGSALYLFQARRQAKDNGFMARFPTFEELKSLLALMLPGGFQQFFFWAGMTVLTAIVGGIGKPELAATNVLLNIVLVMILIQVGFGQAAGTLAGQSLGAQQLLEARGWVKTVIDLSLKLTLPISLAIVCLPALILAPFIHQPHTLALACSPLRIIALTFAIDCFGVIYLNSLQGVGDQKMVMVVLAGCQWFVFLPLAFLSANVFHFGLCGIWCAHLLYRSTQAWLLHKRWRGDGWTRHTI